MKPRPILTGALLALAAALPACAHHARRAPDLSNQAAAPSPRQKNIFQKTGDAAWGVVSAPVRLIAPGKKPAAKKEEPETYEPAEAVIMLPPDSFPPATQPAP